MSTVTVRTGSLRVAAPSRGERMLLSGSAMLQGLALRHMEHRTEVSDVERRRACDADTRRDAQAAANMQLLPR